MKNWLVVLFFTHIISLTVAASNIMPTSKHDELQQYLCAIKESEPWQALKDLIDKAMIDVNSIDDGELTLLHWSASENNFRLALLLLENGAKVNVKDFQDATPLFYAVVNGSLSLVELLLKHGADATINVSRSEGPWQCAHELLENDPTSTDKQRILDLIRAKCQSV